MILYRARLILRCRSTFQYIYIYILVAKENGARAQSNGREVIPHPHVNRVAKEGGRRAKGVWRVCLVVGCCVVWTLRMNRAEIVQHILNEIDKQALFDSIKKKIEAKVVSSLMLKEVEFCTRCCNLDAESPLLV